MKRIATTAILATLTAAVSLAQTTPAVSEPVFEVASIKPSPPGQPGMMTKRPPGRFVTENMPLRNLIMSAYDVRSFQITGGPGWIATQGWDLSAKPETEIPQGPQGNIKLQAMHRALLADRFQLTLHTETREMPVYALVIGKNGHKLNPSPEGGKGTSWSMGPARMKMNEATMALFAQNLSSHLGRIVIDETGLKGNFDFKLEFAPDQNAPAKPIDGPEKPQILPESEAPSLFTALQEQLGLRLESKKGPVQILVIDRAERPSEN